MFQKLKIVLLLTCVLVVSGCATQAPATRLVLTPCPEKQIPPANVMVKRNADFLSNLLNFSQVKPPEPIPSSSNLPLVKP